MEKIDTTNAHLIKMEGIYKIYITGSEQVYANDNINITIDEGEFVAIVGKSGSGKKDKSEEDLNGRDTSNMSEDELADLRNKYIGFIFQQYNLLPKLTLLENVELPLLYGGVPASKRKERALEALNKVGLKEKYASFPNQLSGGQQQRVSIARALAGTPSLLLADEPTGALDSKTSRDVLNFLKNLNDEGKTIVMITHDNSIAEEANRIIRIKDGQITFDGPKDEYVSIIKAGN